METAREVLGIINNVVLGILTAGFLPQILFVLLCFLKPKKYKPAKTHHHFGVVIPARNESKVIEGIIQSVKDQNYPKDKLDIFVIADNCSDNTAEIARNMGVHVIERFDETKCTRGYGLQYGYKIMLEKYPEIESYINIDADNLLHPDYVARMNDAFDSGVELGRGYSNSKNLTDNVCSCVSGLYYIRDARFTCRVRSALGLDQNLPGPGSMYSARILRETGWDACSLIEDTEFTLNRLMEGKKNYYVPEAIYYEEQPTTIKDVFNRNIRMGNGLNKLFFNPGIPMFFKFFTTFRFSYLDAFLTLLFMPISFICCFWIPFYYIFELVLASINYAADPTAFWTIMNGIIIALTCMFYGVFVLQTLLAVALEHKKFINCDKKILIKSIFLFPFYMIIYMIGITFGILSVNPKWKPINHHRGMTLDEIMEEHKQKENK